MTKEELFKKYSVDESHNVWEPIDSWMGVEIYRIMHDGALPSSSDTSLGFVTDFLDKVKDASFVVFLRKRKTADFGSLYLTAKRMVYQYSDSIIDKIK